MPKKLVRRPIVNAPTANSVNAQVVISPDGNWLLWFNSTTVGRLYKWDGTNYNEVAFTAGVTIYHAAWTLDMAYLILTTSSTSQRSQLRSFNASTGATAVLSGISNGSVDNSTIRHFYDDYFVTATTGATAATVRVLLLNRTTNTLSLVASYTISNVANTVYTLEPLESKRQIIVSQNASGTTYTSILLFDAIAGTLVRSTNRQSILSTAGLDVSDDENFWHSISTSSVGSARAGTINPSGTDVTKFDTAVYPTPVANVVGYQTRFMFDDTVIFYGANGAVDGRYDHYVKFDNGVFTSNDGEIEPMTDNIGPFKNDRPSGSSAKSRTTVPVWVFLYQGTTNPAMAAFVEDVTNVTADLFAEAPKGDAFATMRTAETVSMGNVSPMGTAWISTVVPQVINGLAEAPMGDAWFVNVGQNSTNIAIAPLGEATFDIPNSFYQFAAEAPMGDAWFATDFNTNELFALAPIGDATITFTPAWILVDATAPMGEASFDIPNVYVESLTAEAPMGEASFDIPNVYARALVALAPKGDAWFATQLGDYRFVALAPLGDAFMSVSVPDTVDIIAAAPMGDAGIGLDEINLICRRRSMMIIQVL